MVLNPLVMKRTCLFIAIVCSTFLSVKAQDEAAQKAWMDYMTPGPMHKMMAMGNGTWNTDLTFWMSPDGPSSKSTGSCTNRMILGDRYQETVHTGDMGGMQFEGHGITAYDNARKVFQSIWYDNMGTGIMVLEGKLDEATRTLTLTGTSTDPTGKPMGVREVFKWVDDNTQWMEMYMMQDGKEFKSMEMKLTRK